MKTITANKNDSGQRLDKFLLKAFPLLPESLMYKAIRTKDIKVNKKQIIICFFTSNVNILFCLFLL